MAKITPIDYSSRDFSSLINDLLTAAPLLLPEWTNQSDLDFGVVLMDLFAYVGDIMSYYIDRVANETFLATATRRTSVLNIAKMLNYAPVGMAPAKTSLTFTAVPGSTAIDIPPLTQVTTVPQSGAKPVVFETDVDVVIPGVNAATPQLTATVTATQGQTIANEILTSNASGAPLQAYTLFNPEVIQGSIAITITDADMVMTTWTRVDNLLSATAGARVFEADINDQDVVTILFGDNVLGLAPPLGSQITATYRIGLGAAGNIAAGQLIEMIAPITGVASVTNPAGAVGGADQESLDSIRNNVPKSLFALQRAVTLKDYAALALQVSGIAKAQATAAVYTSVLLYVAPVGAGGGTATGPDTLVGSQKYAVQRYFDDKKMVNVTITIADPTYVNVNVVATVHVLPNFYAPSVKNAVVTAVQSLVSYVNVDFDINISTSQVYHVIQAVAGVDYVTLSLLVRGDAATQTGVQDIITNPGEIPQAGTISMTMVGGVQ